MATVHLQDSHTRFTNGEKGLLTYVVALVPTVDPRLSLVEVRRGRGDHQEFVSFSVSLANSSTR